MEYTDDVLERFWIKTTVDHDLWFEGTKCIIWTAAQSNGKGYGRFHAPDGFWLSHRFAYVLAHGPIPPRHEVDHRCQRTACVNSLHTEAVTSCENTRRALQQVTHSLTCRHGHLWEHRNIYWDRKGSRVCKKCRVISVRRSERRRKR